MSHTGYYHCQSCDGTRKDKAVTELLAGMIEVVELLQAVKDWTHDGDRMLAETIKIIERYSNKTWKEIQEK